MFELVEMQYVMKSAIYLEQLAWKTTTVGLQYLFFWKVRGKFVVMEMTETLDLFVLIY